MYWLDLYRSAAVAMLRLHVAGCGVEHGERTLVGSLVIVVVGGVCVWLLAG